MSSTTGDTIANDLYPTPPEVVDSLMSIITPRPGDFFLEPCRGDEGRIYDRVPLPEEQKEWAELSMGRDYLAHDFGRQFDLIITNPPFTLSEAFLEKSMAELAPDGTLVYLQRVNWLGSIKRIPFWAAIGFPGKTPIIIPRPRFAKKGSDSCEYAWFIWDRGGRVAAPDGLSHLITPAQPRRRPAPRKRKQAA
ncbi:MAG: DNA methyltransferase [Aeromonas veronii]